MAVDANENPVLYSMGTVLAYEIANTYYDNKHYVWCTTKFHSVSQPATSDPYRIGKVYLEHSTTGDRHSPSIIGNIAGVLRGAEMKCKEGIISNEENQLIHRIVNLARYKDFLPVLFIIDTKAVQDRCIEVPAKDRAGTDSIEYIIEDLSSDEFQIIDFSSFLFDIIKPKDQIFGQ